MHHRGTCEVCHFPHLSSKRLNTRLISSSKFPIYRRPADESLRLLFSPTLSLIRCYVEKALNHPANCVLIHQAQNTSASILTRLSTSFVIEYRERQHRCSATEAGCYPYRSRGGETQGSHHVTSQTSSLA
ncbi:hypothetical protein JAAARDRAFT_702496 [Jaapia argillacea MUCL 33604]|uniref:Uncharacterized protein n=1 Tax=Jaapia argillacea MUCL 33604 TaxID=933084 RepID=A0A067PCW8_9AGAM|nr:hypothetical protein JAAARDRAFT_702496 [Jaapia argillacea MUCL 33604]